MSYCISHTFTEYLRSSLLPQHPLWAPLLTLCADDAFDRTSALLELEQLKERVGELEKKLGVAKECRKPQGLKFLVSEREREMLDMQTILRLQSPCSKLICVLFCGLCSQYLKHKQLILLMGLQSKNSFFFQVIMLDFTCTLSMASYM